MGTSKNQRNIERNSNLLEEFRHLSTEIIVSRLVNFNTGNEISNAYKQILKERGIDDYLSVINED